MLAATWPGIAEDGSDVLLGVDLAGERRPVESIDGLEGLRAELHGTPLVASQGGPVQPSRPLCLVVVQGAVSAQRLSNFVQLVMPQDHQQPMGLADLFPGPAPLGDAASDGPLYAQADAEMPWHELFTSPSNTGLFGEPQHIAEALALQPWLQPLAAHIFQGHVLWSSAQLLCEAMAGTWGLAHASLDDLLSVCSAREPSKCWDELWSRHTLDAWSCAEDCSPPNCPLLRASGIYPEKECASDRPLSCFRVAVCDDDFVAPELLTQPMEQAAGCGIDPLCVVS